MKSEPKFQNALVKKRSTVCRHTIALDSSRVIACASKDESQKKKTFLAVKVTADLPGERSGKKQFNTNIFSNEQDALEKEKDIDKLSIASDTVRQVGVVVVEQET